jgi:hypothetical protein
MLHMKASLGLKNKLTIRELVASYKSIADRRPSNSAMSALEARCLRSRSRRR